MNDDLAVGTKVRLVGQGDRVYHVSATERRFDVVFYRLTELRGALFLRSSLEVVR